MFGVNGAEFLILIVVALMVVGPERLPTYAEQLGGWVRTVRRFASTAKDRVATELGEEAADVDWASLDPRRYDPRRIVREALLEDLRPSDPPPVTGRTYRTGGAARASLGVTGAASATGAAARRGPGGGASADPDDGPRDPEAPPVAAPFDDEAT